MQGRLGRWGKILGIRAIASYVVLSFVCPTKMACAQGDSLGWSAPQIIYDQSGGAGLYYPKIAVDSNETWHIAYELRIGDFSSPVTWTAIKYVSEYSETNTVAEATLYHNFYEYSGEAVSGPSMAVDENSCIHIIYHYSSTNDSISGIIYKNNVTGLWSDPILILTDPPLYWNDWNQGINYWGISVTQGGIWHLVYRLVMQSDNGQGLVDSCYTCLKHLDPAFISVPIANAFYYRDDQDQLHGDYIGEAFSVDADINGALHVAYSYSNFDNPADGFMYMNDVLGFWSAPQEVLDFVNEINPYDPSIALCPNGSWYIMYQDNSTWLKYITNSSGPFIAVNAAPEHLLGFPSINCDGKGGLHAVYRDFNMSSGGRLMYIHSVGVPPVVLIHGINGTNASWGPINESNLKTLLEEEEGRTVKYFSYPSSNIFNWNMSISDLAHRLDDSLAAWNDSLNIEQNGVDLIAHSMGGLIARYYISHPNEFTFSNKVNKLVTLGTPNYGAALASWGAVVPFATQAVEMEYGSNFTWNLHQAWIAAQPQTQVMTIVGSLNYDVPHDGIVRIPSANLANFGYGNSYVPNSHGGTDGMAYITNTSHPSYQAISAFLSGQPVISNIENVNQFDDGILILGLFNEAGSSVRVATFPPFFGFPQVFWEPDPSLYNFGSGVNFSSGKYWATGANAGSYQLTVVPVGGYSTTVLEDVEILAHLTTLISRTVSPAPGSSSNSFAGGDSPPFVFGSTSVTLDFASGPPCSVSVYRFDENPPNCSAATLPHYWQIESDSLEAPISAQVTIAYDPAETDAEGMQESDMDIAYFDGSWHPLSTNLDLANHTASTTTDVFTLFAIGHFVPLSFNLSQNYPNPFNGVTVIPYELPETALVSLKIYNVRGQVVKILRDQSQAAGSYRAYWDGRDEQGLVASSGVYFYHLEAGGFAQVRKMLLIK